MAGKMVLDGETWFWRRAGRPDIRVTHNHWGKTKPEADMRKLTPRMAGIDGLIERARAGICQQYYEIWRESWSHDYDGELTEAEFAERLVFEGVGYPAAAELHSHFDLSFDDSGMFAGHGFIATFTLDGQLDRVEMFG